MELELETLVHDHDDHSDPSEPEPQYPLPPPIAYFQHGEHGLGSFSQLDGSHEYCVLNTTREDCCSPEHCATIVRRSTLYSECCHHVHTTAHPTTGEPVVAKHSKIYDLLITGVPRTGMWYMQQLLTKTGLSGLTTAEHSAYWTGTVSWKHIFERPQYYFGPRTATHLYHSKFKMIWHMVRDPLAVRGFVTTVLCVVGGEKGRRGWDTETVSSFLSFVWLTPSHPFSFLYHVPCMTQNIPSDTDLDQHCLYRTPLGRFGDQSHLH